MLDVSCATCGYPIAGGHIGQEVTCPSCSSISKVISGVTIPGWMLTGGIAFALGVIFGPALIASTDQGARWLEKRAREKLSGG